ncbi:MAG: permease-like cell division protein FtsX [Oscillospiraceae bacterium]
MKRQVLMGMFKSFSGACSRGLKNLWRNRFMSMSSIFIVIVGLLLLGSAIILWTNIDFLTNQIQEKYEINVYFTQDEDMQNKTIRDIENMPEVKSVRKYTKEQRLKDYKEEKYKGRENILEDLESDNPLRNSCVVSLKNLESIDSFVKNVEKLEGVDEVVARSDVMEKLSNVSDFTRNTGIWIMLILAFVSVFIISNTIKLGMISGSREINIMKFVGATDGFIIAPYVIEGMFIGIIGAGIAAIIGILGYAFVFPKLSAFVSPLALVSVNAITPIVLIAFLGLGLIVGIIGSLLSVIKYLKV